MGAIDTTTMSIVDEGPARPADVLDRLLSAGHRQDDIRAAFWRLVYSGKVEWRLPDNKFYPGGGKIQGWF